MTFDQAYRHLAEIRAMIQHENTLLNARMGWMWALQGLLFSAMGFMWKIHWIPVLIIATVGILSSISIGYSCVRASNAVGKLLGKAAKFKEKYKGLYKLPPTIGARTKGVQWLLPWKFLTWVFGMAWVLLVVYRVITTTVKNV